MSDKKTVFPTTEPEPTSRRTVWIITAAVAVAVVVVIVMIVALNRGTTTAQHPALTTPAASAAPSSGAPGGPGFTGITVDKLNKPVQLPANPAGQILPQTAPTPADRNAAPAGLIWEKLYDLPIVPFSTSDGPTTITDGVPQGWSRTPQGAALAGISILSMWLGAPDGPSVTVQNTLLSGDAQVIADQARSSRPVRQVALTDPELAAGTIQGVTVSSYSPTFATVDIGAGPVYDNDHPSGAYAVSTLNLTWTQGTWKLIVTATSPGRPEYRSAIAGMTPWTS
ncbi:hypothetical protein [Gordonia rhizosphera]|nr:hypothetical protein [Gordonia rhizosphera]